MHFYAKRLAIFFLNNPRGSFIQLNEESNASVARSHVFSRALCRQHVFALHFDWFTGLTMVLVIGQSDFLGICFMTHNVTNS